MSELSTAAHKAREWTERRDALIRSARKTGRSLRDIAEEAGISHTAVAKILSR